MNSTGSQSGFSLVELLIVVVVVAILSIVTAQLIVDSQLRGSQAESTNRLRQEGDFILDQMGYTIRNARSVDCLSETSVSVQQKNNSTIVYELEETSIASSSMVLNSSGVEVSSFAVSCRPSTGNSGTLVNISFTLINPRATPPLEQSFQTDEYVRSF